MLLLPSGLPFRIFCSTPLLSILGTCPSHSVLLDLISALMVSVDRILIGKMQQSVMEVSHTVNPNSVACSVKESHVMNMPLYIY
jgi:hypothetical protein